MTIENTLRPPDNSELVKVKSEPMTVENAIQGVLANPDMPVETVTKIIDLQIRMEDRAMVKAYNDSFPKFQSELPLILQNKKGHNNTYATYDQIIHQIRPIMTKYGFSFSFDVSEIESDKKSNLMIKIMHRGGHSECYNHQFFNLDEGGKMNNSQRIKSALTYAKRALLESALGIATQDSDDDAKRAVDSLITPEQIETINKGVEDTGTDWPKFIDFVGTSDIRELSQTEAKRAINALKAKRKGVTNGKTI